jgi:hypothetical protein
MTTHQNLLKFNWNPKFLGVPLFLVLAEAGLSVPVFFGIEKIFY